MPIFRITSITTRISNGQRLDKGLYIDFQSNGFANPIYNERERVAQVFLSQHGVDLKKLNALNTACLTVKKIG